MASAATRRIPVLRAARLLTALAKKTQAVRQTPKEAPSPFLWFGTSSAKVSQSFVESFEPAVPPSEQKEASRLVSSAAEPPRPLRSHFSLELLAGEPTEHETRRLPEARITKRLPVLAVPR